MSLFILRLVLLCGIYLLALGRVSLGDIVVGLIISATLLLLLDHRGEPVQDPPLGRRLLGFIPFVLAASYDIALRTWDVAMIVLGRRPAAPDYVEVPIGPRTRIGVAVTGLLVTLAPGSVLIDVDWERNTMLFHVFDASEPDTFRASLARFYERYQRWVFP
jgi:multicomponent K+:H+ antiporter subunit E/multicomponent Na+:H+ antiporter subunit E